MKHLKKKRHYLISILLSVLTLLFFSFFNFTPSNIRPWLNIIHKKREKNEWWRFCWKSISNCHIFIHHPYLLFGRSTTSLIADHSPQPTPYLIFPRKAAICICCAADAKKDLPLRHIHSTTLFQLPLMLSYSNHFIVSRIRTWHLEINLILYLDYNVTVHKLV